MKKSIVKIPVVLAAVAATLSPLAHAEDPRLLVGGSLMRDESNLDEVVESIDPFIHASAPDAEWGTDLYVGVAFNQYFQARFGHRMFGDSETRIYSGKMEVEADGVYVALDGLMPVTERLSLGGTLGIQSVDVTLKVSDGYNGFKDDDDARDFFYGLRLQYLVTDQLAVTAAYHRYKFEIDANGVDDLEYDSVGIGAQYRF
ncbi:porin family protein [Alloalcanivorax xenomutans]|uniref:porin family protein n=1 Tax=Alloalcanivorax xenomutans TaxID=1094342 RepID=UPI00293082E1|nr:porin family protein [Alloalcanivorax xenomutans]WOA31710.1 porin family protein [Alloalcanivorax xenomutans]